MNPKSKLDNYDQEIKTKYINARNLVIDPLRKNFVSRKTFPYIRDYIDMVVKLGEDYQNIVLIRGIKPWSVLKIGDIFCDTGVATKTDSFETASEYTDNHCCYLLMFYPGISHQLKFRYLQGGSSFFGLGSYIDDSFNEILTYPGEQFKILDKGVIDSKTVFYAQYVGNIYQQKTANIEKMINPKTDQIYIEKLDPLIEIDDKIIYFTHHKGNLLIYTNIYKELDEESDEDIVELISYKVIDLIELRPKTQVFHLDTIENHYFSGFIDKLYRVRDIKPLYNFIFDRGRHREANFTYEIEKNGNLITRSLKTEYYEGDNYEEENKLYRDRFLFETELFPIDDILEFFKAYFAGEVVKAERYGANQFEIPELIFD
jgi:hypothetical protein